MNFEISMKTGGEEGGGLYCPIVKCLVLKKALNILFFMGSYVYETFGLIPILKRSVCIKSINLELRAPTDDR